MYSLLIMFLAKVIALSNLKIHTITFCVQTFIAFSQKSTLNLSPPTNFEIGRSNLVILFLGLKENF